VPSAPGGRPTSHPPSQPQLQREESMGHPSAGTPHQATNARVHPLPRPSWQQKILRAVREAVVSRPLPADRPSTFWQSTSPHLSPVLPERTMRAPSAGQYPQGPPGVPSSHSAPFANQSVYLQAPRESAVPPGHARHAVSSSYTDYSQQMQYVQSPAASPCELRRCWSRLFASACTGIDTARRSIDTVHRSQRTRSLQSTRRTSLPRASSSGKVRCCASQAGDSWLGAAERRPPCVTIG
jgi:hypothetical protein